jgi:hypothetical protein
VPAPAHPASRRFKIFLYLNFKVMKKYILGFIAVMLVVAISALSMTTKSPVVKKSTDVVWFYNAPGTSEADFQNGSNWDQTNNGSCVSTGNRPCHISASATTQAQLSTYLSGFDKQEILDMSIQRKP